MPYYRRYLCTSQNPTLVKDPTDFREATDEEARMCVTSSFGPEEPLVVGQDSVGLINVKRTPELLSDLLSRRQKPASIPGYNPTNPSMDYPPAATPRFSAPPTVDCLVVRAPVTGVALLTSTAASLYYSKIYL